jgi:protein CASC3
MNGFIILKCYCRSPSQVEKEKELDDDEDRKNPQFIPKKGYFYEHDDRTRVTDEE